MSDADERISLHQLEAACTGGSNRLFQIKLSDGTTMFVSMQTMNFKGLNDTPHAPANTQIHEAVSILASARAFG